jgi:hypothetical protein
MFDLVATNTGIPQNPKKIKPNGPIIEIHSEL